MKIILTKDVKKIGQKGQVVEVSEGYGNNFLIQKGFGKLATTGLLKDVANKNKQKKTSIETVREKKEKTFFEIKGKEFTIESKANEKGSLFVGIHKKDIANIIGLEEKNIILDKDIKEVGEYLIQIKFDKYKAKIKLIVKPL